MTDTTTTDSPAAGGWAALDGELDAWQAAGRPARFWWRDDDAVAPGPALDRLLNRARHHRLPLALAVIPATATEALARRLDAEPPALRVLLHGWSHQNHARPDKKKSELACGRPLDEMLADLARGRDRLTRLFASRCLAVLTPPWNRLPVPLIQRLPEIGINGLSRFKPRKRPMPAANVMEINTHVDPIDWRGSGGFVGEDAALAAITRHLSARRAGLADPDEPTGLLTHHLVHSPALDAFLDRLSARLASHPAAVWDDPARLFTPPPSHLPPFETAPR